MPIIKTIEVEVNAGKAEKDLKGLDKGLQKVDKSVEDIGDTSKETQKEMGAFGTAIDKVTGGGYTGFKILYPSLNVWGSLFLPNAM